MFNFCSQRSFVTKLVMRVFDQANPATWTDVTFPFTTERTTLQFLNVQSTPEFAFKTLNRHSKDWNSKLDQCVAFLALKQRWSLSSIFQSRNDVDITSKVVNVLKSIRNRRYIDVSLLKLKHPWYGLIYFILEPYNFTFNIPRTL